jgi:hypothetical protein
MGAWSNLVGAGSSTPAGLAELDGGASPSFMCLERSRPSRTPAASVPTRSQHTPQRKFMGARLRLAWAPCAATAVAPGPAPGWTPLPAGGAPRSASTTPCIVSLSHMPLPCGLYCDVRVHPYDAADRVVSSRKPTGLPPGPAAAASGSSVKRTADGEKRGAVMSDAAALMPRRPATSAEPVRASPAVSPHS